MRCLTLADKLREQGNSVRFICRDLKGNLGHLAKGKGFELHYLPAPEDEYKVRPDDCAHGAWLEIGWEDDAEQTSSIMEEYDIKPELLIIDHYALDYRFERNLRPFVEYIMVIDDLADRKHDCDILLDQNLQPKMLTRYNGLVPESCLKLLGPQYALLRPEFGEERKRMKPRDGKVERMLVFFGGIDKDNVTAMALNALTQMNLDGIAIDVVIGGNNPHRSEIEKIIQKMRMVSLHCQVANFAHLMAEADLALCASGTTTWERCALGLPTLMISVADNQVTASVACHEAGVAQYLGKFGDVTAGTIIKSLADMLANPGKIREMRKKAQELVDAEGCVRVSEIIAEKWASVKA